MHGERRIEPKEVARVARDHRSTLSPCREDHGGVDHIGGASATTQRPRRFRKDLVEDRDDRRGTMNQSTQRHLSCPIAPDLRERTCRND